MSDPSNPSIEQSDEAVAQYLLNQPDFFARRPDVLAKLKVPSNTSGKTLSFVDAKLERQQTDLNLYESALAKQSARFEEIKANAVRNSTTVDRLHAWLRDVLLTTDDATIPLAVAAGLRIHFPDLQAAVKVWAVSARFANDDFAQGASEATKAFTASLEQPYCGAVGEAGAGEEPLQWLEDASGVQSLALVPLRTGRSGAFSGLLVLGSADASRFTPDMSKDFLNLIGELSSAALARLRT
jgi:uncharacterized protein